MELKQYAIVLVNLDPMPKVFESSEIKKTRPCVVISPDEMNRYLHTIIVAPVTAATKKYPTRVPVNFNDTKGTIAIDQIRTIDKVRILKVTGALRRDEIKQCKDIIKETFVD